MNGEENAEVYLQMGIIWCEIRDLKEECEDRIYFNWEEKKLKRRRNSMTLSLHKLYLLRYTYMANMQIQSKTSEEQAHDKKHASHQN